ESIFANWLAAAKVRAREAEVLDRARDTLEFLGLTHVAMELAGNLSGGQKKLLELGRTMMTDAKLVLLDEPGAGVNPTLMLKVIEMIRRLNDERGYTFCIIEHDMDLVADLCQHVIVLAEGQILTEGKMAEVRENQQVIDAYFGGELA
ncbi:MAG: ATP-binding cassette domain-containing protein, partial [Pseudomonadota bacterium]